MRKRNGQLWHSSPNQNKQSHLIQYRVKEINQKNVRTWRDELFVQVCSLPFFPYLWCYGCVRESVYGMCRKIIFPGYNFVLILVFDCYGLTSGFAVKLQESEFSYLLGSLNGYLCVFLKVVILPPSSPWFFSFMLEFLGYNLCKRKRASTTFDKAKFFNIFRCKLCVFHTDIDVVISWNFYLFVLTLSLVLSS